MASAKYGRTYAELRDKIGQGEYGYQELLSSENMLMGEFDCSRSTVRRAIQNLTDDGHVQNIHGKGVWIIYQPYEQPEFMLSGVEGLKEAMARNEKGYTTKVMRLAEFQMDEKIHTRTTLPIGEGIYYIQRVRYIDGKALAIDHNYFLKPVVWKLMPKVMERSVYEYMEQAFGKTIVTTKRKMTVERQTETDDKYLDLRDYNCLAAISNMTYDAEGVIFEYAQSKHRPNCLVFYDTAHRVKQPDR